ARLVDRDARRTRETGRSRSRETPLAQVAPVRIEILHPVVADIAHIDRGARRVDHDGPRTREAGRARTRGAPLALVSARHAAGLPPVAPRIGDIDRGARLIDGDAVGGLEFSVGRAE